MIFLLPCIGCGNEKKGPRVGYIDTDKLMQKWEKFKTSADEYTKEREQLMRRLARNRSGPTFQDRLEVMKSDEKWDKLKRELRDEIKAAAAQVAKDKKLDIILDNGATSPIIEYGGVDVTNDVVKVLKK
jgi:Skp family chaperone for outer membrane proteins